MHLRTDGCHADHYIPRTFRLGDKNDLTIISKSHAHPHTMKKTHAKFQNDQYKTVRGVMLARGTHCLYIYVYILRVKNDYFFFFFFVLRPFQEYFIYIELIVHQRWAKTGEPGENPLDHP